MQLVLAPWEWHTDPEMGSRWRKPGGDYREGCLDLRSNSEAGTPGPISAGLGLFVYEAVPAGLTIAADLGDDPLRAMTAAERRSLADALGLDRRQLGGTTLAEALAEFVLGGLADPTGVARALPLRMNRRGCALDLKGFGRVYRHRLDAAHPSFIKTLEVRRLDYERVRQHAIDNAAVRGGDPDRALDPLRRWNDWDAKALGVPLDQLVPANRIGDGILPHQTTLTENWPTNGTTISTGQDNPWNEDSGNVEVASGKLQPTADGGMYGRCTTNLSSDDHSHEATGTLGSSTTFHYFGVTTRKVDSTVATYYFAYLKRFVAAPNGSLEVGKVVAGTPTSLDDDGTDPGAGTFTIKGDANGSTVRAIRGATTLSQTDTSITGNLQCGYDIRRVSGGSFVPTLDAHTMADLAVPVPTIYEFAVG